MNKFSVDFFKILGVYLGGYYIYEMYPWFKEVYPNLILILQGECVCLCFIVFCFLSLFNKLTAVQTLLIRITGILGIIWYIFKGIPNDWDYYINNHNYISIYWLVIDFLSVYYVLTYFISDYFIKKYTNEANKYIIMRQYLSGIGLIFLLVFGGRMWIK